MVYTQGADTQMDYTVKHWEHSHSGTVTVEKQQQQQAQIIGIYSDIRKYFIGAVDGQQWYINDQQCAIGCRH